MADKTTEAHRFAREQQSRINSAAAMGMNALKPIVQLQVTMLRMWADSIERFTGNYEQGVEKAASAVEEHADKDRAA